MGSIFSNYSGNLALTKILAGKNWLALHMSVPPAAASGELDTEVAGGGYQRQPIDFSTPSGKSCTNTTRVVFNGMPAVTVKAMAVWDAVSDGNLIAIIDITSDPIQVNQDEALIVEVGDIGLSL